MAFTLLFGLLTAEIFLQFSHIPQWVNGANTATVLVSTSNVVANHVTYYGMPTGDSVADFKQNITNAFVNDYVIQKPGNNKVTVVRLTIGKRDVVDEDLKAENLTVLAKAEEHRILQLRVKQEGTEVPMELTLNPEEDIVEKLAQRLSRKKHWKFYDERTHSELEGEKAIKDAYAAGIETMVIVEDNGKEEGMPDSQQSEKPPPRGLRTMLSTKALRNFSGANL